MLLHFAVLWLAALAGSHLIDRPYVAVAMHAATLTAIVILTWKVNRLYLWLSILYLSIIPRYLELSTAECFVALFPATIAVGAVYLFTVETLPKPQEVYRSMLKHVLSYSEDIEDIWKTIGSNHREVKKTLSELQKLVQLHEDQLNSAKKNQMLEKSLPITIDGTLVAEVNKPGLIQLVVKTSDNDVTIDVLSFVKTEFRQNKSVLIEAILLDKSKKSYIICPPTILPLATGMEHPRQVNGEIIMYPEDFFNIVK